MLRFFRDILRTRDLSDPNSLSDVERLIFTALSSSYAPNVVLLCVRLQLLDWIRVGRVAAASGLPNWFKRRYQGSTLSLDQLRIVGGNLSYPRDAGVMSISATAQCGSSQVRISFELNEALTRVTFDPFSSLAELAQSEAPPEASFDRVPDDRPYWEGVGERFSEFTPITDALLGFLGQARASLRQRIVLPVPAERPIAEIEGIALPEIYARLLAYSDGIRINNLNVWGSSRDGQRVFTIDSKRFLYFGGDANHLLALPIRSGVASDAVLRLPARRNPVRTGHDILSLCDSNLNRTSRG